MGYKSSKPEIQNAQKLKIDIKEQERLKNFFSKFIQRQEGKSSALFLLKNFEKEVFLNFTVDLISYLNSYCAIRGIKRKVSDQNFDLNDFVSIYYLINKSALNDQDDFSLYYKKNSFLVLYDFHMGQAGAYEKNIDINDVSNIFDFIIQIYILNHIQTFNKKQIDNDSLYKKENLTSYLVDNLEVGKDGIVLLSRLTNFIDNKLYNLDSFIKNHFRLKFLEKENELNFISSLPVFTEKPSSISIDKFLFFCLSNPHLYSRKYAFKLYDCSRNGYNIPSLIYSFIGFSGPVAIFIENYDKEEGKDHVLGIFLNSEFKECYEKFCGDDLSFIFTLFPKMECFKVIGDREKIAFISSKNQKFGKTEPGIGLGYAYGKCRFWIDSNECFKKSYFNKYDDVFEEGSPFNNPQQVLNISNIDVYGFGNDDAMEALYKKQAKDKMVADKMKKVDKAAFVDNDFNKEMFFDNAFGHQKFDKKSDI